MRRSVRTCLYGGVAVAALLTPTAVGMLSVSPPFAGIRLTSTAIEHATLALAGRLEASLPRALPTVGPRSALDAISVFSAAPTLARPDAALGYAPVNDLAGTANPLVPGNATAAIAPQNVRDAIAAYRSGTLATGDAAAADVSDPVTRTALEWMALRLRPTEMGFGRITAFRAAHEDWPSSGWLRRKAEEALVRDHAPTEQVRAFFRVRAPDTVLGKFALARALRANGETERPAALARAIWRDGDMDQSFEATLRKDFGAALTRADYKYRADRLTYKDRAADALRSAALAGPDVVALERARLAVADEQPADKLLAAVSPDLRKDPGFLLAQIQILRRAGKLTQAALLMATAPRDAAALVDGDEWWTERRVLARKLLDSGDARTAFALCAEALPAGREARVEAAFHAGWIALRFLADPDAAARQFAQAAPIAETPMSRARVLYWQGRAAEAHSETENAAGFFRAAATQASTYYGQLARERIGDTSALVRPLPKAAEGDERAEAVRAIDVLLTLGQRDVAQPLAVDAARSLADPSQLAALADVVLRSRDARITLAVGKTAGQRGFALDTAAFPTFGVPPYEPLANSAPTEVVYAIARQESAFDSTASSSAGAKGLMQMILSTAQRTAKRAGVAFDAARLTTDAAFNAQLGAAHLGDLLVEQRDSQILTFAAYNAGGKRVKEWIEAYGDPRDSKVDAVDWVERIPFTETRNYVQRVSENLAMYRALLGVRSVSPTLADKSATPADASNVAVAAR